MVEMACLVMLLGNLVGGLLSSALHAFEQPAPPRKNHEKPSVRLFAIGETLFIAFAVYFHTMVKTNFTSWEIGYWVASALMAPLFAVIGSQISKIALAEKLAANRKAWRKIEAERKAKATAQAKKDDKHLTEEEANLTKLQDDDSSGGDVADVTKLNDDEEGESAFDDSMNITNVRE